MDYDYKPYMAYFESPNLYFPLRYDSSPTERSLIERERSYISPCEEEKYFRSLHRRLRRYNAIAIQERKDLKAELIKIQQAAFLLIPTTSIVEWPSNNPLQILIPKICVYGELLISKRHYPGTVAPLVKRGDFNALATRYMFGIFLSRLLLADAERQRVAVDGHISRFGHEWFKNIRICENVDALSRRKERDLRSGELELRVRSYRLTEKALRHLEVLEKRRGGSFVWFWQGFGVRLKVVRLEWTIPSTFLRRLMDSVTISPAIMRWSVEVSKYRYHPTTSSPAAKSTVYRNPLLVHCNGA
ncbi:hypothetical protein EJ08DRAFT_697602 [Tothia fuscella]|uniref:Uncharacterized protein n=1 Tax=Tothia fuscella TaxID=1048955 RepID=A0A9P4NRZ1_9PEZI|nr:hypothetical protein EJ08DRAFT_697602 [Tothia fuscella]